MKLLFKQRLFSWFDSYDIYDEEGNPVFAVEGKLDWGHRLHIMDTYGTHLAPVKEVVFTLLPRYEFYMGDRPVGTLSKELTFLKPKYDLDYNGWMISGDVMEWEYSILGPDGGPVASISKQLFNWTDTYVIDVLDPNDAIYTLMIVLAIDAEKCSRD